MWKLLMLSPGNQNISPLATHAYEFGHIAGENAAGGHNQYEPVVKNISVKIFNKYFASVGLSSFDAAKNNFETNSAFVKARN